VYLPCIYDALKMGTVGVPSLDPFQDILPLPGNDHGDDDTREISYIVNIPVEVKKGFVNPFGDDDDNVDFSRNAFDITIDDEE